MTFESLPLGKHQPFPQQYDPQQLCRIPRALSRQTLAIKTFQGYDLWRVYELSWLNEQGKPRVAALEITIPASSDYLVESKSLKLYLGSLNQTRFVSAEQLLATIQQDLEQLLVCKLTLQLFSVNQALRPFQPEEWGVCIDDEVGNDDNKPLNSFEQGERLCSHLLRSLCPVTGQPDWASLVVEYQGIKINHSALLNYIVSLRNHAEFHEQCVERIFVHLMQEYTPTQLSVYAAYTRRGGIEINPFRSNGKKLFELGRSARQ